MTLPSFRRLLPVLALASVSIAWAVASPVTATSAVTADGPDLHDLMKGLKNNLRTVGKGLADPAADASVLAAINEMEVLLLAAKGHKPSNLDEVPRDQRTAHTLAYRADIARTLIETLNLEIAVLEGRREEAVDIVRGKLKDMRDAGHEKYEPSDDD